VIELAAMTDSSEGRDVILPDRLRDAALDLWRQSQQPSLVQVVGENSMAPLIRAGDFVLIEHRRDDIRRGDVVVFRTGRELITHRVISVQDDETSLAYITKGDNVLWADPAVPATEIIGRVLSVKRGGRQLNLRSRTWRALSWFLALIMLLWVKTAGTMTHAIWGDRPPFPRPLVKLLSRSTRLGFTLLIRGLELLFGRWRA
jgi:signal peptidase I